MYVTPKDVGCNDAFELAHGDWMQGEVPDKQEVLPNDVDLLYGPDENEGADDNVSGNTTIMETI